MAARRWRRRSPTRCAACAYYSPFGMISTPPSIEFGARAHANMRRAISSTSSSRPAARPPSNSALRFVQFYFNFIGQPQKKHIITREYAYHGSTYLSASVSGKPGDRGYLDFVTDTIHHLPAPNPYRRPDGMSEAEFCEPRSTDLERQDPGTGAREGGLLHRRAAAGLRRRHRAAQGLSEGARGRSAGNTTCSTSPTRW